MVTSLAFITPLAVSVLLIAFLYWRYIWFFRNPHRVIPEAEGIVSPAEGTVVYVKVVHPGTPVVSIKKGRPIFVSDILSGDVDGQSLLIGVFMSPFDVHYNRAPIPGRIVSVRHHPARLKNHHMGSMHFRSLIRRFPIYENSPHISENERLVTRIDGTFKRQPLSCQVVQIAGGSVNGIDSYVSEGQELEKGEVFGMIRIGSQVDVVLPWNASMNLKVKPGDRVRAGESILVG
jgi:phosphatidylserine decarboxylase